MNFEYKIILSNRRSISISISPQKGVIVRAPQRTSLKTIDNLVKGKSAWITRHLSNQKELKKLNTVNEPVNGSLIPILGSTKKIIVKKSDKNLIKEFDEFIEIGQKNTEDTKQTGSLIKQWYKLKAEESLTIRFNEISGNLSFHGLRPSGLKIRSMKSRWGSCSSKGTITLNSELIKLDYRLIDYVIIHELCHLIYHNHSTQYYRKLQEIVPDYKELRRELRQFTTR